MADIIIKDDLAKRLRRGAKRLGLPLDDFLELLLSRATPDDTTGSAPSVTPGTLAALADAAKKANLHLGVTDTAARSREILEREWGDHLTRRSESRAKDSDG